MKRNPKTFLIFFIIALWFFAGWPPIWNNPKIPPKVQEVQADTIDSEDFEADLGDWTDDGGSCVWIRDVGGTPSSSTGPNHDNTYGDSTHYYIFVETSSSACQSSDLEANLEQSGLDGDTYSLDLSFYYHMYGSNMGDLHVDVNDGTWHNDVWSVSGQQHSSSSEVYTNAQVDLDAYTGTITIRFRLDNVGGYRSDAALDDIEITGELRVQAPSAPTLYPDDGGSNQIAFNNIRQNSTTPTFRTSATHTEDFNRFQLELNTAADFSGTAYTQTFSGTYTSGTQYNLTANSLSPSLPMTDGVTYYVRMRASADGGTNYGVWSTDNACCGTWSYNYKSVSEDPDWLQTTDEQFATGTLTDTTTSGSDSVELGTAITATGGTISESGGYKFHTFTSSGTFEVTAGSGDVEVLVVGGGAGGGTGGTAGRGGGGAGGIVYDDAYVVTVDTYTVTVGAGGAPGSSSSTTSENGGNSVFDTLTALGGGGAGPHSSAGQDGGSGGGGSGYAGELGGTGLQPGSASGGYGSNGGASYNGGAAPGRQGGGGGVGGAGQSGQSDSGGNGGVGLEYSQFSSVGGSPAGWFGGGGGGGASSGTSAGSGGQGGGGAGGSGTTGGNGVVNTGGGGGGATSTGGTGGSGIVIVRYSTSGGSSGTIMSPAVDYDWLSGATSWNTFNWSEDETNGSISVKLFYNASSDCDTVIPNAALFGNESGFTSGPIDISNLDSGVYNRICLQATLNDSGGTPYLQDWMVTWLSGVAVSVTITTDGTVDYGLVAGGATKSTIDLSDTQTAQNDGSVTETFNIKTSNATNGTQWTIGSSPGSDVFVHEFSTNSGSEWTKFSAADSYQTLATGINADGTQNFDLRITAPTESSDYQEKTISITIQAVQE